MMRSGVRVPAAMREWLARLRRAWHFAVGPSRAALAEAQAVLGDREYYELYDDLYRQLDSRGATEWNATAEPMRQLVYRSLRESFGGEPLAARGTRLLDLGCGIGVNAVRFAQSGYAVTGIDISPTAIGMARRLAAEQGVNVDFRVGDVLDLQGIADVSFAVATDIGCLHMLVRAEHRRSYLHSVRRVLEPGGSFFLFNRAAVRDVRVAAEDAQIARSITYVQERWRADDGAYIRDRGCGFRVASLRQYEAELREAGFDVVRANYLKEAGVGVVIARVPRGKPIASAREG
jgi:ubiquinone/menaquinone biosynthesis C-methylase UbiE